MTDLNMYNCSGRIGQNPEVHTTSGGKSVTNFSIAVSFYEAKGQYGTMWVNCSAWGQRGEYAAKALKKGDYCMLTGSLRMNRGKDGNNYLNMNVTDVNIPPKPKDQYAEYTDADHAATGANGDTNPMSDDIPF